MNAQQDGILNYDKTIYIKSLYRFSSQTKCLYKILNNSFDASQEDTKAFFFELTKKYHPDSNQETSIDPEKFREIQQAYSKFSNPEKRKYYDQDNCIYLNYHIQGLLDNSSKKMGNRIENIQNKMKLYSDHFEKQYFRNLDYFKLKGNDDSLWNMSYNLYKKHYEIKKEKSSMFLVYSQQ